MGSSVEVEALGLIAAVGPYSVVVQALDWVPCSFLRSESCHTRSEMIECFGRAAVAVAVGVPVPQLQEGPVFFEFASVSLGFSIGARSRTLCGLRLVLAGVVAGAVRLASEVVVLVGALDRHCVPDCTRTSPTVWAAKRARTDCYRALGGEAEASDRTSSSCLAERWRVALYGQRNFAKSIPILMSLLESVVLQVGVRVVWDHAVNVGAPVALDLLYG